MFQLGFLHSGLLIFAAATVLPLIIWLIARRKPPRVIFSSLRFIKLSQEQEKKRSKLKNILLLIIRMLIILLIALAVARPQVYSSRLNQSSKHPPTALAIVLDTSFSMDYLHESRTLLDRAKEALSRINGLCGPSDKISLITLDESWNTLHSQIFAGSIPADLISALRVTHTPIRMEEALQMARGRLIESGLPNRELYLITDGQQNQYPEDLDIPVYLIPLDTPESVANLSVKDVQPRPQLVDKTRLQSLDFTLINHGPTDRKDVLIRAILGDTKVAEKFVTITARQEIRESILVELREDGWQTGYVEVVDEGLLHDNRSWFAFPHRVAPSVAVISQKPSLPFYLDSALRVYTGSAGSLKVMDPATLTMADLDRYQSFVIYAAGNPSARLKELLDALIKAERGALVLLDEGLSPEAKSMWESTFGCRIGSFIQQPKDIASLNPHHYISALLSGKDMAQKRISHYWSCRAGNSASLASASGDDLVMVKGRMVLFAFDPAALSNSFFIGPIFPVLTYRALEHSGLAQASGSRIKLGDLITADTLVLPDGSSLELARRAYRANFPGIYQSKVGSFDPIAIAVDHDPAESDITPHDFSRLKYVKPLKSNWSEQVFRSRLGHDIWKILLMIALALFLLEIVIVKLSQSSSGLPGDQAIPQPGSGLNQPSKE